MSEVAPMRSIRIENCIKRLRKARGWTLDDMAAITGVGRATIGSLETGRTQPRLDTAFMIARGFERPIERVFRAVQD